MNYSTLLIHPYIVLHRASIVPIVVNKIDLWSFPDKQNLLGVYSEKAPRASPNFSNLILCSTFLKKILPCPVASSSYNRDDYAIELVYHYITLPRPIHK